MLKINKINTLLLFILFLSVDFPLIAHKYSAGDTVTIVNHDHDLVSTFTEDGDHEFVCYNRVHRNLYSGMLIGLLILLILVRSRYKIKQKASIKLQHKNELIESYNKDFVDSLHYASRIQKALLPSSDEVLKELKDHFIYYEPRDIVSGDFYWFTEKDHCIYIAVIDCTGHGVPGAFLSILGHNAINKVVNEMGIEEPSKILHEMNNIVKKHLKQDSDTSISDGMEIGLLCINQQEQKIHYAGAGRSLYWINEGEFKEIKASKHTVGSTLVKYEEPPINHEIIYKKGDSFYLFTDGYADQFGGENDEMRSDGGKKMKYRRFKDLIKENHQTPMSQQKDVLEKFMQEWRGDIKQVDDICVIGVKV